MLGAHIRLAHGRLRATAEHEHVVLLRVGDEIGPRPLVDNSVWIPRPRMHYNLFAVKVIRWTLRRARGRHRVQQKGNEPHGAKAAAGRRRLLLPKYHS